MNKKEKSKAKNFEKTAIHNTKPKFKEKFG
jgi:hypothetical protein